MNILRYIWHDCFLLTTAQADIVFDYFASMPAEAKAAADRLILDPARADRPLYAIVSHHHKDHFTRDIFAWQQQRPRTRFIISNDTRRASAFMLRPAAEGSTYSGFRPRPESVSVLREGERYDDEILCVEAFGSTDIGNSYLITLHENGRKLFHAGDLNAWIWKDESTPAEVDAAMADFERILGRVSEAAPRIDVAMFPVDSRIGTDYFAGARRFVRAIDVALFIPMHFCLADSPAGLERRRADALAFDLYANPARGQYLGLTATGDCWAG